MKRYITGFIAFIMIFSQTFAITIDDAADILVSMNLMSGYPDGTLGLDNNITRAEFCTLVAKMLNINNEEQNNVKNEFNDLKENHWAYKSVMALLKRGFISGYEDNTFRPSNTLTYAECCSILIGVLGYKGELSGAWPTNVTSMAELLKIDTDLTVQASDKMTRGLVSIMLVNSMNIKLKN